MVRKPAVNWKQICDQAKVNDETRIKWLERRIVRKQLDIMSAYHYVQNQGKLMMQSRENAQKPQFGQFFWRFRGQISPSFKFFWKTDFVQIEGHL